VRGASVGTGWWSDVLADAIGRTPKLNIVSCYTRSQVKQEADSESGILMGVLGTGERE
jgi:hypothetical protein